MDFGDDGQSAAMRSQQDELDRMQEEEERNAGVLEPDTYFGDRLIESFYGFPEEWRDLVAHKAVQDSPGLLGLKFISVKRFW